VPQQPDLNWRNPAVRTAMYDQMQFWLARGVAGFRLDAVPSLFEDPTFAASDAATIDNFPMPKADGREAERSPMQWTAD
jgi:glycosidase